jgi:hypothetical protein
LFTLPFLTYLLVEADHDGGGCRNRSMPTAEAGSQKCNLSIWQSSGLLCSSSFFSIYFHSPWLPSGEVKMFSGRVLQLATVTVTIAKEGAARSTAQSKRLLRSHKQMTSIPPLAAAAATAAIVVSVEKPNDVPVYLF